MFSPKTSLSLSRSIAPPSVRISGNKRSSSCCLSSEILWDVRSSFSGWSVMVIPFQSERYEGLRKSLMQPAPSLIGVFHAFLERSICAEETQVVFTHLVCIVLILHKVGEKNSYPSGCKR